MKDFETYSKQIHGINMQLSRMHNTGNNIIDAILWNKSLLGERKNIALETAISLPPANCIHWPDLGSILDFLLDAWLDPKNFEQEERKLYVTAKAQGQDYEIIVKDKARDIPTDQLDCINDLPGRNLPQQINVILSIVKKNNGFMYYQPNQATIIRLPLPPLPQQEREPTDDA